MTTNYNPRIVTDNLVLCLDSANTKSYPGSGTTWFNLVNSVYSGTSTTLATTLDTPGIVVSLNTSSAITITLNSAITKYNFTFSYWGRPYAVPDSNYQPIFRFKVDNTATDYFIGDTREVATPSVLHYVRDFFTNNWDTRTMINTAEYNNFRWHYYTLVMNAENNWRSYLDGVLIGTNSTPTQDLSGYGNITSLVLGGSSCNFHLSNITLYNKPLSADEINQNYNAMRGRYRI